MCRFPTLVVCCHELTPRPSLSFLIIQSLLSFTRTGSRQRPAHGIPRSAGRSFP